MKRLISFLTAVLLILSMNVLVFAEHTDETADATLDIDVRTDNESKTFNYGGSVTVDFSLELSELAESNKDVTALIVGVWYDSYVLSLDFEGSVDSESEEKSDFSSLVSDRPENWEVIGSDKENYFEICICDSLGDDAVDGGKFEFSVPFRVKEDANAELTELVVDNIEVYNNDFKVCYSTESVSFELRRAVQPDKKEALPEGAIPLDIAGYKHAANNVICYFEYDTTVADYISSYITAENGETDMNYFAVAIVDAITNTVVMVDSQIGRPQSDKSQYVISANHYIIGVNGNKQSDYTWFSENVRVGQTVTLYNINLDMTDCEQATELSGAGFTVTDPNPILLSDAPAVYDEIEGIIYVYKNPVTVKEFSDMFVNSVTVTDNSGEALSDEDLISTGLLVNETVRVVLIGDVNGDGVVDQYDYILIKRHYFNTFEITGDYLKAGCISNGETIEAYDYIFVRRIYFKTLEPAALIKSK